MAWLIYGANGYTGRLVARLATARGERPVLAGRSAERVAPLAASLGLEHRAFDLTDPAALLQGLDGIDVVAHCAGPFSATGRAMIDACIETGAHYADVTGEIDVFEYAASRDAAARGAGVVVMPGSGFDVAPSDCLAAMLAAALPDALQLELAFVLEGGFTGGTAKTVVENMGRGARVRVDGELRQVPLGWKRRRVPFPVTGERMAVVAIPWADVSTAYRSTGIPTITAYSVVPAARASVGLQNAMGPLMRLPTAQTVGKRLIGRTVAGPDERKRARTRVEVWGEVRDAAGRTVTASLSGPNAYDLTADSVVRVVQRLQAGGTAPGFHTASTAFGSDYVRELDGVEIRGPARDSAAAV